jgi:hypothetical protein
MATVGLYGSSSSGVVAAASGSESTGLYGNNTSFGGSYFEWFIFQVADMQPATPTGGSWDFTTNSGTPPSGWSSTPPANPTNIVWVSIALVNSKTASDLTWSVPGKFSYSSGLPILSGSGIPSSGVGQSDQLYIQLDTTPQAIWFKETGTWTRLTGSSLYVDLTSSQTIAGTKTFSSQIQGSISGNAANVTGIVGIANGGTGSTTASGARAALGAAASGANNDITSLSGLTTALSVVQGGTGTSAPSLVAGTNVSITGTWPNQTISSSNPGGTVISVAATVPSFLTVTGSPITSSGTLAISYSGTALPVANGGTGVTSSSGANSVVLRDANANISVNCLFEGYTSQAASGITITLTAASVQNWNITGSGGQTIKLPDATTLPNGALFTFNNNQSSGAITVVNNSNTTVATIQSGGFVTIVLTNNSIAAGSWDRHDQGPSNVSWSTNTFDYPGSITSATWNGSVIAINRGGTNGTATPTAGAVAYGTGTAYAFTTAGSSGQVLTSAGTGTPTWTSLSSIGVTTFSAGTTGLTPSTATSGAVTLAGTLAITNGGTGQTTANAAFNALVPSQVGNGGKFLTTDGTNTSWATNPLGTVTSVDVSGGTTGLTTSGSPITTSGTITLAGTLGIANGGTGATTAAGAATNLGLGTGNSPIFTGLTLSGGTANGVTYLNGSKVVTTGSALTFDGTDFSNKGKVISGGSGVGNGYFQLNRTDAANLGSIQWVTSGDEMRYSNNNGGFHSWYIGSEQMRLNTTGLGIGTSSITAIYGGKTVQLQSASGATNYITTGTYNALMAATTDGKAHFGTSTGSTSVVLETANGIALTIDPSNNAGLGVTPSAWATVKAFQVNNGSVYGYSTAETGLTGNAYYNAGWKYIATGYATKYTQGEVGNGIHAWFTAPSGTAGNAISFTQAMTLDASANLWIGTTPGSVNTGAAFLATGIGYLGHPTGTSTGTSYIEFRYNNTTIGSITQSGTTAVLYNVTSDQRLKENIVDAPEFGSVIDSIKVRSYDWKADGNHQRAGFIAQELATVAPEAVHQPEDPEQMMAVDYSKLVPMLVKEIQSLRTRVAQLEGN